MEFSGIDVSLNTVFILLALVALETVLSADNAVALAAFVQPLSDPKQQRQALNWGLAAAFVLRISLLFTATWVMQFWQFEFAGALYLLWLAGKYFWEQFRTENAAFVLRISLLFTATWVMQFWQFEFVGALYLLWLAGKYFWEQFRTENAAYLTVLGVEFRLLCKAGQPDIVPPDWIVLATIGVAFAWGFSRRTEAQISAKPSTVLVEPVTFNSFD